MRHVVFSASVAYAPGDVAVLVPRNAPRHINAVLRALRKNDRTLSLTTTVTSSLVNGTLRIYYLRASIYPAPARSPHFGLLVGVGPHPNEQRQKLKELPPLRRSVPRLRPFRTPRRR